MTKTNCKKFSICCHSSFNSLDFSSYCVQEALVVFLSHQLVHSCDAIQATLDRGCYTLSVQETTSPCLDKPILENFLLPQYIHLWDLPEPRLCCSIPYPASNEHSDSSVWKIQEENSPGKQRYNQLAQKKTKQKHNTTCNQN
jgi:hypothetical protein